jgi:hypothetical protein
MADETRNAVELLDQDNDGAGCMRMEFLLESKGLGGCIDGPASVQGSEKDRKARALMGLHVKEHHLATEAQGTARQYQYDGSGTVKQWVYS